MKYLKGTLCVFAVSLALAAVNVKASHTLTLTDVTIPVFKGVYISSQQDKTNYTNTLQSIKKTKCTDDLSGDGRVILAKVHALYEGMQSSAWVEAKGNTTVYFDDNSRSDGAWKLWLESNKSLPTTASFYGVWTISQ